MFKKMHKQNLTARLLILESLEPIHAQYLHFVLFLRSVQQIQIHISKSTFQLHL